MSGAGGDRRPPLPAQRPADQAGTDESTRQAGAWLTDNGYEFFEGDPIVVEGPIGIAAADAAGGGATAAAIAGPGWSATPS